MFVSLPRRRDAAFLPCILPLIERRLPGARSSPCGAGGRLRIDVSSGDPPLSFELHDHALRPLPTASPLGRYDYAFVVHETAEGDIEWSRLIACVRKGRQVFLIHHAAAYVSFPCDIRAILGQKAVLRLRRWARRIEVRLASRLAASGQAISTERIQANERKLDWLANLPSSEWDARFGEGFREYFAREGGGGVSKPLCFRGQAAHTAMAETLVGPLGDKRILDLGCGFGIHSLMLREAGNHVVGLDLIEQRARLISRYGHANLLGLSGVGERLPFADGSFDVVFAHDSIQHVCDIAATFAECRRVLRPGGAFVVSEVHPYHPDLYAAYGPWAPMRLGCRQLYLEQRADYLRDHADIPEAEALRVARRTESFTTADLDALIAARLSSRVERSLRGLQAARGEFTPTRSIDGWCEERYLRPAEITRRLARAGFAASRMRTACLAHDGGPTARIVFAGPFTDLLFPRYMIVAKK